MGNRGMVMESSGNNQTVIPKLNVGDTNQKPNAKNGASSVATPRYTPRFTTTKAQDPGEEGEPKWNGWLATQRSTWLDIRPSTPTIAELLSDDEEEETVVVENQELPPEMFEDDDAPLEDDDWSPTNTPR